MLPGAPTPTAGDAQPKDAPPVIGSMAGNICSLTISQIDNNPEQPRREFDPSLLEELAQSIRELGIIQPITVHKVRADKYQIISGERRFRATQLAGLEEVPAYIREVNDQTLLEMALVENIQREDLHAIEIAISFTVPSERGPIGAPGAASLGGSPASSISTPMPSTPSSLSLAFLTEGICILVD